MKVQVNLSEELVGRIDALSKKLGVSRSAFCAMIIAQGSVGLFKMYDMIDGITLQDLGLLSSEEKEIDETNQKNKPVICLDTHTGLHRLYGGIISNGFKKIK